MQICVSYFVSDKTNYFVKIKPENLNLFLFSAFSSFNHLLSTNILRFKPKDVEENVIQFRLLKCQKTKNISKDAVNVNSTGRLMQIPGH